MRLHSSCMYQLECLFKVATLSSRQKKFLVFLTFSPCFFRTQYKTFTVADPGFPRGGGANPLGAPAYDLSKISQKLHENERIWTGGGEACPSRPLRSATDLEVYSTTTSYRDLYFIPLLGCPQLQKQNDCSSIQPQPWHIL